MFLFKFILCQYLFYNLISIKDKPPDVRYRQRNQQVASGYDSDGKYLLEQTLQSRKSELNIE